MSSSIAPAGAERVRHGAEVVASSAPLAVCSVCLSDPEQADVPPNALWVAIATSTSRRFSSTAARKSRSAAAEDQRSQRRTGSVKPSGHELLRRLFVGEPRHR